MASSRLLAAACHVSPITLSAQKTTGKCISLIKQASKNSANLVVFPEAYIPAFPVWSSILAPTQNHHFFERMAKESIFIDGDEMHAIQEAAKQAGAIISIGVSEKVRYSTATLFNSNVIIGSDVDMESWRWIWITRCEDEVLQDWGVNLWREYEPVGQIFSDGAREQLHISTWPAVWPTIVPDLSKRNPADKEAAERASGQRSNYDNVASNRMRAAAHCFENKSFGIMCTAHLDGPSIDAIASESSDPNYVSHVLEASPRAATMFLDPTGAALPGYVVNTRTGDKSAKDFLQMEEDILYAELDMETCVEGKQYHDVIGGYQRLDVFDLKVNRTRKLPARFVEKSDSDGE